MPTAHGCGSARPSSYASSVAVITKTYNSPPSPVLWSAKLPHGSIEAIPHERQSIVMQPTWEPHEKHGHLTERSDLPDSVFAFPKERKEPLTDATHVRNAIARFDQTTGVSDEERELAFANIKKAAECYGIHMTETDWHELGSRPRTGRTAEDR